jgi:hypothetical protein
MSDVTGGPPPSVDAQDPLPESSWFYRRVYTFIVSAALIALLGYLGFYAPDKNMAFKWTASLLSFVIMIYIVAPSADQITRMIQTASMLKSGVSLSSTKTATAPDGSTATATTAAGGTTSTGEASASAGGTSSETELPGKPPVYTGPPVEDIPPVPPEVKKDVPWAP